MPSKRKEARPVTVTESTDPAVELTTARAEAEAIRSDYHGALAELARQQQAAPAGVVGHVAAEETVQRLAAQLRRADQQTESLEWRAKHAPPVSPAEVAPTDQRLAGLEAAHAEASCDLLAVPDGAEHDAERDHLNEAVATLEAALDEHRRDQRRHKAAEAESARRREAAASEQAEADLARARAELASLVDQRLHEAIAIDRALGRLTKVIVRYLELAPAVAAAARACDLRVDEPSRPLAAAVHAALAGVLPRGDFRRVAVGRSFLDEERARLRGLSSERSA